jgi:hypothetical protein
LEIGLLVVYLVLEVNNNALGRSWAEFRFTRVMFVRTSRRLEHVIIIAVPMTANVTNGPHGLVAPQLVGVGYEVGIVNVHPPNVAERSAMSSLNTYKAKKRNKFAAITLALLIRKWALGQRGVNVPGLVQKP